MITLISFLLIIFNIPMLIVISKGIQLHTDSKCPEDIKSVKHNKMALQGITAVNIIIGIILLTL